MRFDLAAYQDRTAKLDDAGIDYDSFRAEPLDDAALRCVRYMHDVELHTVCYLRDLLVTRVHRDPDVTTFLTFWVYEEYWHGDALGKVLLAHGERAGRPRMAELRARHRLSSAMSPPLFAGLSAVTPSITAVHMAWGALNEWTTQAGYRRLAARSGHPVLTDLLGRIARQEGRHIDFYASQAGERLGASRSAQRVTRFALRHAWGPVGSSIMPSAEVAHICRHLFGDADGMATAQRIDRRIDRLPGLGGLDLVTTAVRRWSGAALDRCSH